MCSITESNGTAFINSGECFDGLKKQKLEIKSPWHTFDEEINHLLELALLTMNHWSTVTALAIRTAMENPGMNQKAIAKKLGKSQSSISEALNRGGYEEIMNMERRYRHLVKTNTQ
jgi:DNA-binding MarR family transcriptional regulator